MNSHLYLEISENPEELEDGSFVISAPLDTLIVLCVRSFCDLSDLKTTFVVQNCRKDVTLRLEARREQFVPSTEAPWMSLACRLPSLVRDERSLTAGVAATARRLAKMSPKNMKRHEAIHPDGLLGFRQSCLQSPSETSVWTKYCESQIINTTLKLIDTFRQTASGCGDNPKLIEDVIRFEYHLGQPLRIHNVYKLAREMANMSVNDDDKPDEQSDNAQNINVDINKRIPKNRKWKSRTGPVIIESSIPIEDLGLDHSYAEGPYVTLADVLLYPCFYIIFTCLDIDTLKSFIPLTFDWFQRLKENNIMNNLLKETIEQTFNVPLPKLTVSSVPKIDNVSLYKCDPKRSNKKRVFTKEQDIETALKAIRYDAELIWKMNDCIGKIKWEDVPNEASPFGGHLPEKRMLRKRQQLENLACAVIDGVKDRDKIVDFCSGGGHLGILLAFLLPKCDVILLENKEESLKRARERVANLKLNNVYFFQCNLDHFVGDFDMGVALHACGVSTDLVLENCIGKRASFVICPCCYGSLHETDRLRYPQSEEFSNVSVDEYMCISHAADQTHVGHQMEQRGARCMAIVDSDRARHAMGCGYNVKLSRLVPLECTPKNMLITGVMDNKY